MTTSHGNGVVQEGAVNGEEGKSWDQITTSPARSSNLGLLSSSNGIVLSYSLREFSEYKNVRHTPCIIIGSIVSYGTIPEGPLAFSGPAW